LTVALVTWIVMGGADRALLLAVPPLAVLAAFALPTLGRSTAAAIDWFSVFFFSVSALGIWVLYAAMHTGFPPKPAANVAKLLPNFVPVFQPVALAVALLATLAWIALVQWRAGRHRHPLWKSLVLPASGVALSWLLLMTLWLPAFDYARSVRPLTARIARHVPRDAACIAAPNLQRWQLVALEVQGGYRVDAVTPLAKSDCQWLLRIEPRGKVPPPPPGWQPVAREWRPANRDEVTAIFKRAGSPR
jgi:hypothetical protein